MIKRILVIALLSYCFIALLGCALMSKKGKSVSSSAALEPQAILKFSDVPVPVGFKLLAQESYAFESAGVRVGVLRYQGKADIEQVVNFYKEQMIMYNWNFLNAVEYGQRLMNFDRDNETCVINLVSKGKSVLMTISVGPKSQVYKKSAKPVK